MADDAFDERRRGLEEEYFRRKDKEAIEKLREKLRVAERPRQQGLLQCVVHDATVRSKSLLSKMCRSTGARSAEVFGSIPVSLNKLQKRRPVAGLTAYGLPKADLVWTIN